MSRHIQQPPYFREYYDLVISKELDMEYKDMIGIPVKLKGADLIYTNTLRLQSVLECLDRNKIDDFSSVIYYDCEDYLKNSDFARTLVKFRREEIYSKWGITLNEYLDLPRYLKEALSEAASTHADELKKIRNSIEKEGEESEKK